MIKHFCFAFVFVFFLFSPLTASADVVYGNEFFYDEFGALIIIIASVIILVACTAVLIKKFWKPNNETGGKNND